MEPQHRLPIRVGIPFQAARLERQDLGIADTAEEADKDEASGAQEDGFTGHRRLVAVAVSPGFLGTPVAGRAA